MRVLFPWIQKSPKHNCFIENIAFDCHSDACFLRLPDDILFIIANLKVLSLLLSECLNMNDPNAVEGENRQKHLGEFQVLFCRFFGCFSKSALVDACGHFQVTEHNSHGRSSLSEAACFSDTQQMECAKSVKHMLFSHSCNPYFYLLQHERLKARSRQEQ